MSDADDKARIEQLEAELAQLRDKVDPNVDAVAAAGDLAATVKPPSTSKVVLFGAIVVVLSLGFFIAVYTALSKGFNSLATKAASSYASDFTEEDQRAASDSTQPPPKRRRPPTVPGL